MTTDNQTNPSSLTFRKEWPFNRMWPVCQVSQTLCRIAKRQTLKEKELSELSDAGFVVYIQVTEKE